MIKFRVFNKFGDDITDSKRREFFIGADGTLYELTSDIDSPIMEVEDCTYKFYKSSNLIVKDRDGKDVSKERKWEIDYNGDLNFPTYDPAIPYAYPEGYTYEITYDFI